MSRKIETYQDCRDSKAVLSAAKSNGVDVREGKGSHFVMRKEGETMTGYHGDISDGVARKIFKFFIKVGVVAGLGLGFYGLIMSFIT